MHNKDARSHGEAALAWTEAVTRLVGEAVPDDLDH